VKSLTLDKLRRDGEAMSVELSREFHQSGAGYKASAELQPIYAKYPHVLGDEALSLVRGEFESAAEGSEARRGARLLLDWQVDGLVARELAPMEEKEIAWESSAVVKLADGRTGRTACRSRRHAPPPWARNSPRCVSSISSARWSSQRGSASRRDTSRPS
jgi:hypothetical protein